MDISIKVRSGLAAKKPQDSSFPRSSGANFLTALCIGTIRCDIMQNSRRTGHIIYKPGAGAAFDLRFLPTVMTLASLCQISSEEA